VTQRLCGGAKLIDHSRSMAQLDESRVSVRGAAQGRGDVADDGARLGQRSGMVLDGVGLPLPVAVRDVDRAGSGGDRTVNGDNPHSYRDRTRAVGEPWRARIAEEALPEKVAFVGAGAAGMSAQTDADAVSDSRYAGRRMCKPHC
jgi:hypothetical protein